MNINVTGGTMSDTEIAHYKERAIVTYSEKIIDGMDIEIDGEFVNITYHWKDVQFERIRRITGYLVGSTSKWNNGKLAELKDRVTHG
jgi:anaerobic ribonucleoside-triphosphate reductase